MKKLLLSSIIMLGICSFVSAQNALESKSKKLANGTPAATPQKSSAAPVISTADGTTAEAKVAATEVAPITDAKYNQADDAEALKQKEAKKAAAEKAKKNNN